MSAAPHDPELRGFEEALQRLTPCVPSLDRDGLMFRAGQAAAPKSMGRWHALAAVGVLTSLVLGTLFVFRPPSSNVERIVYVKVPIPVSVPTPEPTTSPDLS